MSTNAEDIRPLDDEQEEESAVAAPDAETDVRSFVVSEEEADTRLDRFLSARLEDWSRTRLQALIEGEAVLVNERVAKSSLKLRAGDQVEVELLEAPPSAEFAPEDAPVEIVYEDDVLAVINKPAGLIVHPGAGVSSGTLANRLAFHFNQLSSAGGRTRPGIVHRLDRDTSGLLVVAKTEAAHEHLSDQFRQRLVSKRYTALVFGRLREPSGVIEEPIGRDPFRRTRMSVLPIGRGGRSAYTRYRTAEAFRGSTLFDVHIKTGRTHQIRVHLTHIRHPVVGDQVYAGNRIASVPDTQERLLLATLKRQFLHAAHLGFTHPQTAEFVNFDAPLPEDLAGILDSLRALYAQHNLSVPPTVAEGR